MEKVRHVGESYELNKFRTLNKTIELDARLANERLLATKFRLNDLSSLNDKLRRELSSLQSQFSAQEKKLIVAETMLRQLMSNREQQQQFGNTTTTTEMATKSRLQSTSGCSSNKKSSLDRNHHYIKRRDRLQHSALGASRVTGHTSSMNVNHKRGRNFNGLAARQSGIGLTETPNCNKKLNRNDSENKDSKNFRSSESVNIGYKARSFSLRRNEDNNSMIQEEDEDEENIIGEENIFNREENKHEGAGCSRIINEKITRINTLKSLESHGTQTARRSQLSRTRLIIDDLRRRLNLVGRSNKLAGEF